MSQAQIAVQTTRTPLIGTTTPVCRPLLPQQQRITISRTQRQAQRHIARAQEQKPDIQKFADDIGLPTDEGLFGFKPFPEVWVGRLAMAGFVSSIVGEFITKRGTLGQLGLITPNPLLLTFILAAASGASVFGFGRTLARAQTGNMSPTELKRYGKFLGVANEASAISETETEMKQNWNKGSSSENPPEQLTGSASQNPTDTFSNESPETGKNLLQNDPVSRLEQSQFGNPGLRYARDVEIQNGRAAMLGFLGTTAIEAWTGKGILSQLLWYLKLTNVLGPGSGF